MPEENKPIAPPIVAREQAGSLRIELVHVVSQTTGGGLSLPQLRRWLGEFERLAGGTKRHAAILRSLEPTPLGLRAAFDLTGEPLAELTADLQRLRTDRQLDHLKSYRGRQLLAWQERAREEAGFAVRLTLVTPKGALAPLTVDATTDWAYRQTFVAVELYLYGTITRMGGRLRPRVQIRDEQLGTRTLDCPRQALADERTNRLYRRGGVHAAARLNLSSGQLDRWQFLGFQDLKTGFHAADFTRTLDAGATHLRALDPAWLRSRRGAPLAAV